jgi:hypothetical protein
MIEAVLLLALAAPGGSGFLRVPRVDRVRERSGPGTGGGGGPSPIILRFAPSGGAGMSAPCACTAVTGSTGEPMLGFARASTATCYKNSSDTNIATGDYVTCAANAPRIMTGSGVGVTPTLGILLETGKSNSTIRSAEFDNAAWLAVGTPTLNGANGGAAPDGTFAAEDYTFAATTSGQVQGLRQPVASCDGLNCVYSIHVKSALGIAGTVDVCAYGASITCVPCNYPASTFARCSISATATANPGLFVGNNTLSNGGTNRPSNRVLIWGAQTENGTFASSYIPTSTAVVTRSSDTTPTFAIAAGKITKSMQASLVWPSIFQGASGPVVLTGATGFYRAFINAGGTINLGVEAVISETATPAYNLVGFSSGIENRTGLTMPSTTSFGVCIASSCVVTVVPAYTIIGASASTVSIGFNPEGVVKDVCLSTDFTCGGP